MDNSMKFYKDSGEPEIIIVEDDVISALFLEQLIKGKGFNHIKKFRSAEKFLNSIVRLNPFLVFMDISLAGEMNGLEAVNRFNKPRSVK